MLNDEIAMTWDSHFDIMRVVILGKAYYWAQCSMGYRDSYQSPMYRSIKAVLDDLEDAGELQDMADLCL